MRAIGLAGAAFAAGYLFRAGGGVRMKNLTRDIRSMADAAGAEIVDLGRSVGVIEEPKKAPKARKTSSTAKKASGDAGAPKSRKSSGKRAAKA